MNNLGGYQLLTKYAKKVGGPTSLILLIAIGGYALIRPTEAVSKKIYKIIKNKLNEKSKNIKDDQILFDVSSLGKDNTGLEFNIGDKYRVLESDGDSILIERLGDKNNPYFVSGNFLKTISNFGS